MKSTYKNLLAELTKADMSVEVLASMTGMNMSVLYKRLKNETRFRLPEMQKIREVVGEANEEEYTLDYLFEEKIKEKTRGENHGR